MKKFIVALCALALMASCREFEPVFTLKYADSTPEVGVTDDYALSKFGADKFTTINNLKNLYKEHGKPVEIEDVLVIKGEVTSSDESGNVYREIYIQDATGAIDFKIGRSSSYDDYKPGQILYINCQGLTLGEYGFKDRTYAGSGQLQLGLKRNSSLDLNKGEWVDADEYETSYIDLEPVLRAKVLKGVILPADERIKPNTNITGTDIMSYGYEEIKGKTATEFQSTASINHPLVSQLVAIKGLTYADNVFVLFYPNSNLDHKESKNRVFMSLPNTDERWAGYDYTFGIKWWALTKTRFLEMVEGAKTLSPAIEFSAYSDIFDATSVAFLQRNGINDVIDLMHSNPALIKEIIKKDEQGGMTDADVAAKMSALLKKLEADGLKTKAEWFSLNVGSTPDRFGPLGKAKSFEDFFGVEVPYIDLAITYPSAQSVSQYFEYQGAPVAIRTSGYARFADLEIPAAVLAGEASIDVVGILGRYQGSPQITMLNAWLSSDTAHEHSILNL